MNLAETFDISASTDRKALTHLTALGVEMTRCLDDECGDCVSLIREKLVAVLQEKSLVDGICPACEEGGYGRELIYVDPAQRFTMLVLRWKPGAKTPVHGHKAWGVVGVHSGELGISCYDRYVTDKGVVALKKTQSLVACSGDTCAVGPDPEGIHSISNETDDDAYSVHIYGMDISSEPNSININYSS